MKFVDLLSTTAAETASTVGTPLGAPLHGQAGRPHKRERLGQSTVSTTPQSDSITRDIEAQYDRVGRGILAARESGDAAKERLRAILSASQPGLYWMEHKIQTAFTLGGFDKGDRLLEVGCTAGGYTMHLAREGYDVTGLDISSESIAAARVVAQDQGLLRRISWRAMSMT